MVEDLPKDTFEYHGMFYTIRYRKKKWFGLKWGGGGTVYCYHCFWCGTELSKFYNKLLEEEISNNNSSSSSTITTSE